MHRLSSVLNPTAILFSVLCLLPLILSRAQTNAKPESRADAVAKLHSAQGTVEKRAVASARD